MTQTCENCSTLCAAEYEHPCPDWQPKTTSPSAGEEIMTDRELLELAAKAAGIKHHPMWRDEFARPGKLSSIQDMNATIRTPYVWNPLTDDGDALRLAVQLSLSIDVHSRWVHQHGKYLTIFNSSDDPYTATRRAIVRAAAAIGKEMKE